MRYHIELDKKWSNNLDSVKHIKYRMINVLQKEYAQDLGISAYWYSNERKAKCGECFGRGENTSSSCKHAKALERFMNKTYSTD